MKSVSRLAKFFLLFGLIGVIIASQVTVFATEIDERKRHRPSDWAVKELFDAEACGILPLDWQTTLHKQITKDQLEYIIKGLEQKFIQAGLTKTEGIGQVKGTTRGGVLNSYYNLLTLYGENLDINTDVVKYMKDTKLLSGDIQENKPCTVQEASLFAMRILKNVYEQLNEGAKGYVWKATYGAHTVYLVGTTHVVDERLYPFNKRLNTIIQQADKIAFEVDFNDTKGQVYLRQKQKYLEDTTLRDNIPEELYNEVVVLAQEAGYSEAEINTYKPWALSNQLLLEAVQGKEIQSTDDNNNIPLLEMYMYTKSLLLDKDIIELEGYRLQANRYDEIVIETQIESLAYNLKILDEMKKDKEGIDPLVYWVDGFVKGDTKGLGATYAKANEPKKVDEMAKLLNQKSNEHISSQIITYLNEKGDDTYVVVVSTAHLLGEGGIIQQLRGKGYKVEEVK